MQNILNQITETLGAYLPNLLGALLILVLGLIVALIISAIVRGVIKRTFLKKKLAIWIGGEEKAENIPVERYFSKVVFYLIMLFVLVAFFQTLGLTIITEPLNNLLNEIFLFAPELLAAVILFLVAWILAIALKVILTRVLGAVKLDERLGEKMGLDKEQDWSLTKILANAAYWLVFLLFLPAILTALSIQGMLEPVQEMLQKMLQYLPNILGAVIVISIGWFIAMVLQKIISNLLAAVGLDRFSEKAGIQNILGTRKLSGVIGLIVQILILIPVLIIALNTLALEAVTEPASNMLNMLLSALPSIFAASLLIIISYIVGRIVSKFVTNILAGLGFDNILTKLGLRKGSPAEGEKTPSEIAGFVVLVIILFFAIIEAANLLNFTQLSEMLSEFITFTVQIILGLIIFGLGLYLANWVYKRVKACKTEQSELLALVSRISILILSGAMALRQMGMASDIINLTFSFLVGAVAIAAAIAFGIGGREFAAKQIEKWSKKTESNSSTKN